MKTGKPLTTDGASEEVSALIATLHETGQRLEELTWGEVDTVADRDGRTFLLRGAQEQLRDIESAKQAAILDALPARIALLDAAGRIVSVNRAWTDFAGTSLPHGPGLGVGLDYVESCDNALGEDSSEARQMAKGVRSVLAGEADRFALEYPCHSPTGQRRFLATVAPLARDHANGAVVMHLDVTVERQTEESLRVSESRFRQVAENIRDVFFLAAVDGDRMIYVSPAYEEIWGRTCESLYANPESWTEAIHADDRASTHRKYKQGMRVGKFQLDYRIVRPDGSIRWIEARCYPVRDDAGAVVRIAGVAEDVTQRNQASDALLESERRFSDMLGNIEMVSVMLDTGARITYSNDYLLRLTGWKRDEVIGRNFFDLFIPPEAGEMKATFTALLADSPGMRHHENEIITRSGDRRLIRWNNSVLRSGIGDVIGAASIGEDVTERKKAEDNLAYLNRVYAVLSGINTLIVRAADRDELFREACRIAVDAGGFRMAWIGMIDQDSARLRIAASAGVDEGILAGIASIYSSSEPARLGKTMAGQAMSERKPIVCNDVGTNPRVIFGARHAASGIQSMAILPLVVADEAAGVLALYAEENAFFRDEELTLLAGLAGDIAFAIDHIGKAERLDYLAYYDALTRLANRALFLERVAQYMRGAVTAGHRLAVLFIDLERFKNINDSLGQAAGDELLRQVAQWLVQDMGDASLLARIGADHFAVVLPELAHEDDVTQVVEKMMEAFLDHPFRMNDAVFRVAAKMGVALFPNAGTDADTLFRNAEAALKKAKATGDRYLVYTPKMTEMVAGRLTMENQLRQALDRDEFVLHYQPKISLATGKLTGAEALIRWNDPGTGLVPPMSFIPILEETGLIQEVGRWALRKTIEQCMRWRAAGLPAVRVAVNISPLQLRNRGFIAELEREIAIHPHAAAGLEMELTENLIMADVKHSVASLQAIRAMGITIAIDDFGTGFSSLSYLARLPVDTLKIDRSFVVDMTASPQGLALVSTIIDLAHSLKLKAVAEGVESEEQSRLLRLLGCDEMQGYLVSTPVPAAVFEAKFLSALLAA